MGLFNNLLINYAVITADMIGYTMQKILALHRKAYTSFLWGCDKSAFKDLVECRKMAGKENHWFEELWILLDEVHLLLELNNDQNLFYEANCRLLELHAIFDMPDEEFKQIFEANYIIGKHKKIQEQTYECLMKFYDGLYIHADYMTAHMNYKAGLLCGKAMGKIEMLTQRIPLRDRMERLFKMAVDLGSIRELDLAMSYYNSAINLAKDENDLTYEYIALLRKLSICLSSEHLANHVDFDSETMSAISRLNELCEINQSDLYTLGEKLVQFEQNKADNGTKNDQTDAKWRIDRLREAMPMLHFQLALSRGDWQTARIYADELKEKELEAYGSSSQFSNSDLLMPVYAMLYNSEDRKEANELQPDSDVEDVDEPFAPNFPDGMSPLEKHRYLILTARGEMMCKHQMSAHFLCEQAKAISKEMYSDYHYAMAVHSIGQSYESVGKEEDALTHYREVIRLLTEDVPTGADANLSSSLLYTTFYEIGNLIKNTDPKEAIRVLTEAINLLAGKKNDEILFLESALIARAVAKSNVGDIEGKEKDCLAALELIVNEAKRRMPFIDKELRENLWSEVIRLLHEVVSQVEESSSPSFRRSVYDAILIAKGFLLSSEKAEKEAIYKEETLREYIPLFKALEEYEISKLPWGTMTENSAGQYVEQYMKSMMLQKVTNGVIGKYYDFMHISFSSIVGALNDNDVVLDYYDYPLEDGDQQYIAFVYRKGHEAPEFVKVCRESDLKQIYNEVVSNEYEDGSPFHVSEAYNPALSYSHQLCDRILLGISSKFELSQGDTINYVPSGSLHKIPVESLNVTIGTNDIVSDFYADFIRMSHVRTILSHKDDIPQNIGLFGGLNYGEGSTSETKERGYKIGMDELSATPLASWGELKQTLSEVKNISFLWQSATGMKADTFTGFDGSPELFKNIGEKGCSIMHLATHGFFETKKTKVNIPGLQGAYRPMDLTGIVMSNGNEGWLHGNNTHHEGILTATDIAKMDLSKTQLVVLSACYTGEGVVRSDGVFGLQRAFKKAGAKSLVMSLWNEYDEVGSLFMSLFYSHLLLDKKGKRTAFKYARREIQKKYPHPLFWANFIMID